MRRGQRRCAVWKSAERQRTGLVTGQQGVNVNMADSQLHGCERPRSVSSVAQKNDNAGLCPRFVIQLWPLGPQCWRLQLTQVSSVVFKLLRELVRVGRFGRNHFPMSRFLQHSAVPVVGTDSTHHNPILHGGRRKISSVVIGFDCCALERVRVRVRVRMRMRCGMQDMCAVTASDDPPNKTNPSNLTISLSGGRLLYVWLAFASD